MTRERILITGGSGLLGSNILRMMVRDFEVYATYNSHLTSIPGCEFLSLDIRDGNKVLSMFREVSPHLVIHTAALANVDYCEDHPEEAWAINVKGTENVAKAATESKLIFISTDSVFDGKKGMYTEESAPAPLNTYSKTKLEAERLVRSIVPGSIIIRTAFYGWSLYHKTSLAEWVVTSLRRGKLVNMFTDVFFSPIFAGHLALLMIEMYRRNLIGVYHVGGRERCSKYTFGLEIARAFGLDVNNIQPSSIVDMDLEAPRPRDLSLDVTKVARSLETQLPSVREGIKQFRDSESELDFS